MLKNEFYNDDFDNIPELHWNYGYFLIMGIIFLIGNSMSWWFKRRGWLNFK